MAGTTRTVTPQFPKSNASGSFLSQVDEMRKSLNAIIDDFALVNRVMSANGVAVGNVGAGEDDLQSGVVPATALFATGYGVKARLWGTTANNVNAKTLKVYFGTTAHVNLSLTASIAGRWVVDLYVIRTGPSTQDVHIEVREGVAALAAGKIAFVQATDAQNDALGITIKATGTATTDNDIVQEGMLIELVPLTSFYGGYKVNLKY